MLYSLPEGNIYPQKTCASIPKLVYFSRFGFVEDASRSSMVL